MSRALADQREHFRRAGAMILACCAVLAQGGNGQTVTQLDSPGATREIPDFANGGTVSLASNQIIDVVILGDGYLAGDLEATDLDF